MEDIQFGVYLIAPVARKDPVQKVIVKEEISVVVGVCVLGGNYRNIAHR